MDNDFLNKLNFELPNIVEDTINDLRVYTKDNNIFLDIGEVRWMVLTKQNKQEVFQFYSHYKLAKGHCICTGLGFAIRENWLLTKSDVSKITVLEKNKNLIDYHKKHNSKIIDNLEVINIDAFNYYGSCDTLLLDHYEGGLEFETDFLYATKLICENIKHNTLWFWPLEMLLSCHYKNYLGLNLTKIYNGYKKFFKLKTLPSLNENELFEFCKVFYVGKFLECNFKS